MQLQALVESVYNLSCLHCNSYKIKVNLYTPPCETGHERGRPKGDHDLEDHTRPPSSSLSRHHSDAEETDMLQGQQQPLKCYGRALLTNKWVVDLPAVATITCHAAGNTFCMARRALVLQPVPSELVPLPRAGGWVRTAPSQHPGSVIRFLERVQSYHDTTWYLNFAPRTCNQSVDRLCKSGAVDAPVLYAFVRPCTQGNIVEHQRHMDRCGRHSSIFTRGTGRAKDSHTASDGTRVAECVQAKTRKGRGACKVMPVHRVVHDMPSTAKGHAATSRTSREKC